MPIEQAAAETVHYERATPFHPSGIVNLGSALTESSANSFLPPPTTLTIRNFKLDNVFLDTANLLLSKDGRKIPETAYLLPTDSYDNSRIEPTGVIELDRGIEYVISSNRDHNYYHWLIQAVPAIDWAMRTLAGADIAIMVPGLNDWQIATIDQLGHGDVPRVYMPPTSQFFFPRVSYSEFLTDVMPNGVSLAAAQTFEKLRNSVSTTGETKGQIIYVARTDSTRRVAANEQEVMAALAAEGVRIVVPGSLSFPDQIALFANAAAVIGPHGAGLSNVVFCRPGTPVYEMLPMHHLNYCFNRLALAGGLDYYADAFPSSGTGHGHDKQWLIDGDLILARLRAIRERLREAGTLSSPVALARTSGAMEFLRQNQVTIPAVPALRPAAPSDPPRRYGIIARLWHAMSRR